mgnify:CR=1 FL=1
MEERALMLRTNSRIASLFKMSNDPREVKLGVNMSFVLEGSPMVGVSRASWGLKEVKPGEGLGFGSSGPGRG